MLVIKGASTQAIAAAAAAAALSGEAVALDPSSSATALPRTLVSGTHHVVLPNGSDHQIELIVGPAPDADMILLFASPYDLHHRGPHLAAACSSTPTVYAPATFAGWAALVGAREISPLLTGVLAGFPAVGDVTEDRIQIRGMKKGLPLGGVTVESAAVLARSLEPYLDSVVPVTAAEAELSSSNVVLHGPLLLAHLTDLADPEAPPQKLYRGSPVRTGSLYAEAVDLERVAIGRALGIELATALDLALAFYRDQGMAGTSLGEALESFPGFSSTPAPISFDHRYIEDDVIYGLAGWESLGASLRVSTRAITAVTETLSIASGRDLRTMAKALTDTFLRELPSSSQPATR
ncbi:MAG: NAD/NADP octopine/nopaline dehydrogenase family protein [Nocardioides sp.]|uniref:NAD/NADP octopine/nopaline dehydrogenase family protein n=1 Tax=Nocardioides sp. TaxID=35761 RepID=UPI003D6AD8B4